MDIFLKMISFEMYRLKILYISNDIIFRKGPDLRCTVYLETFPIIQDVQGVLKIDII